MKPADHDIRAAQLREWLRTGMWFIPSIWAIGSIALAILMTAVDEELGGDSPSWLVFGRGHESAQQVLAVIAGSTLTFTGVVFSITIVALQLASTQFSPRVLRAFIRDRGTQHCLGVFVATFLFALMVLREVGSEVPVPGLSVTVAFALVVLSLFAFVYLVHHISTSVRVVSIIDATAAETRQSIRDNYPEGDPTVASELEVPDGPPDQVVCWERGPGALLAVDEDDLVRVAHQHDCVLVLLHPVGDYLPSNIPLFAVHGGAGSVTAADVQPFVGVGAERTLYQDTAFGLRQLVDIAEKALSPAVNDPTTAVQCIDRLHDLLRRLAVRPFASGSFHDADGALRLVVPQVSWEDLVRLAFDEIRLYGAGSLQIPRRLRAALLDLASVAPPDRRPVLWEQLAQLDHAVDRAFDDENLRALAHDSDAQGMR